MTPLHLTDTPLMRRRAIEITGEGETVSLRMADWNQSSTNVPLLCIHGLTRTGRDFDALAGVLGKSRRVICPDIVGRGESSWLSEPSAYTMSTYLTHFDDLIRQLECSQIDVLGASMGGLLAIAMAARSSVRVRKLVVVDIGGSLPQRAMDKLVAYLSVPHVFDHYDQLLAHVRKYYAIEGQLSEAAWRYFTLRSVQRLRDGRYTLAYDPRIHLPFKSDLPNMKDAWDLYDRIRCPTLLIRGEHSHVLPIAIAQHMEHRGPKATVRTIPNIGHYPLLLSAMEIDLVQSFLDGDGLKGEAV